jgi:hypothetical protein
MVGGLVERLKLKWLVRSASEPSSMSRSRAIAALGSWPYADDAVASLARIIDRELDRTIYGAEALEALCRLRCDRATACLVHLLDSDRLRGRDLDTVIAALVEPWRGDMVPALADRARRECRGGDIPAWFEAAVAAAGSPDAAGQLEALVPDVTRAGLDALGREPPRASVAEAADGYLGRRDSPDAAQARIALRRALTAHYLHVALTARDYAAVAAAVSALEGYDLAESREALRMFRSRPSRPLRKTQAIQESDGAELRETVETVFSSVFGQPPGEEEQERQRAEAEAAAAREQVRRLEAENERRDRVFNDLINLGTVDGVAAYARRCLEEPEAAPGLARLADYLDAARTSALAANLAARLAKADRSRLETFLLRDGSMASIAALEALGHRRLWERLLEIEEENWASGRRVTRDATALLCARYPEEMSAALVKVLRDEEPTSRRLPLITETLAQCGDVAVKRVRHLLSDPRWAVRRHAVGFLARVGGDQAHLALADFLTVETDPELRHIAEGGLDG